MLLYFQVNFSRLYITNYYDKSTHGKVLEELYMSVIAIVQMIKFRILKGKNIFHLCISSGVKKIIRIHISKKKNPNYWFEKTNKRGFTCCK